jgi:FKBP12-rapamycin complex-associated protein
VLELFNESLKYNSQDVNTWHMFGLTNFKRIQLLCLEQKAAVDPAQDPALEKLITDAFTGLFKSISLGGAEFTETMQDTLKMLELWFKYGDLPSVQLILKTNYQSIDIICWLNVVPQMITKLDIANEVLHGNVLDLLEFVGTRYPQGIIFQLMLAAQSKTERRKKSAIKLISKLTEKHSVFVEQAETISKELRKVAILLEEEWLETIDEALKYQAEGKYDIVLKIMMDLHKKSREDPESQNEVLFYQKYGFLIREAENYLNQYKKYKDPLATCQACEIYIQLLKEIEESMNGIETVVGVNARSTSRTSRPSC